MSNRVPSIACIGVIGKSVSNFQTSIKFNHKSNDCTTSAVIFLLNNTQNNPLHISLFPPENRDALQFSFLLSSCLDIFEIRMPHKTADQDFGLLQAIDERLSMYGWLTNTGVKLIAVVDMEGRHATSNDPKVNAAIGIRDADLKPVSSPIIITSSEISTA